MKYCTHCGTKILDDSKYCTKCGNKLFEVILNFGVKEHKHNSAEEEVIDLIMNNIGVKDYRIDKNCDNYSTLVYNNRDLFRIKFTNNSKWIRILMLNNTSKEYYNSELFNQQKNKNQAFWYSPIKNIYDYRDILLKTIEEINTQKKD